jgi:CRP-like cAMP-binding protein
VIKENESCDRLYFLLNGTLDAESSADDHSYRFIEEVNAPEVLQPERLFGLHQRFTKNFICKTEVNLMTLEKGEVMKLSEEFGIFRLNLLNIISAQSQKLSRRPWQRVPQDIEHRITRFLESHCDRPAGPKTIYIRMADLARELNESRLDVSRALNRLSRQGTRHTLTGQNYHTGSGETAYGQKSSELNQICSFLKMIYKGDEIDVKLSNLMYVQRQFSLSLYQK